MTKTEKGRLADCFLKRCLALIDLGNVHRRKKSDIDATNLNFRGHKAWVAFTVQLLALSLTVNWWNIHSHDKPRAPTFITVAYGKYKNKQ